MMSSGLDGHSHECVGEWTVCPREPYHSQPNVHAWSVYPPVLSAYASTKLLPATLQHSIPGLGLRVTRVGVAPTCQ